MKKISDIVTCIDSLGGVAGVASGEITAMGTTIAVMGESEIATTGIKNFILFPDGRQFRDKIAEKGIVFLRINPKKLAVDMQKDARSTMLHVLDSMAKVPEENRRQC